MINPSDRLTILHDDNSSFTEYSDSLSNYSTRNSAVIVLDSSEDYLYVGYEKAFRACYPAFSTANTNANTLSVEYYNGSTWASLTVLDDTKGFTRDGAIQWSAPSDWASVAVNSITKYYIRIRPSATSSASTEFRGLNLLFSDDEDLKGKFPLITDSVLLQGEDSHILVHESVRNDLIQQFRTGEYKKLASGDTQYSAMNMWDLFDIHEVRTYSIYMALSTIFLNASDNVDDHWYVKHLKYEGMALKLFDKNQVSLDTDDDGEKDDGEVNKAFFVTTLSR